MRALPQIMFATVAAALFCVQVPPALLPPMLKNASRVYIIGAPLAVAWSLYLFYQLIVYSIFMDPLRNVPGPKFGYWNSLRVLYSRIARTKLPVELYMEIAAQTPNNGIVALRGFGKRTLLLTKPDPIRSVLVGKHCDYIKPPIVRKFLSILLGDGLVLAEGDKHKFIRKNTLPAFTPRNIRALYPMMWGKAKLMTSLLQKDVISAALEDTEHKCEGTVSVDICYWATRVSLDVIGRAALGCDFNSLQDSDDPLANHYEFLMETSFGKILWFFLNSKLSRNAVDRLPWHLNRVMQDHCSSIRRLAADMVRSKEAAIKESSDGHTDILGLLVKTGKFEDEDITDQLLTWLVAGHETTSSAFAWSCYLLAIHQTVQADLRAEVQQALALSSSNDLATTLENLPLLNGVMHETLRLYPTAPILQRVANVDTQLQQYMVPKGTPITIPPWLLNRSPEFWGPDSTEFRPHRWIDAEDKPNQSGGGKTGILTFLHGPRGCIGEGFSKAELRCLISSMVENFSWTLDMKEEDVVPAGAVTVRPGNGLKIRLKPVE